MEFLYIVVLLLVCSSLFLFYKTRNLKQKSEEYPNIEKFEQDVITAVDSKYNHHIDALRNFAGIANYILQEDSFNIPASTLYMNETQFTGNLEIDKDLTVDGNVNFIQRDTNLLFNIFPRYIIINWYQNTIPKGWALCDGNKYSINTQGNTVLDDSPYAIQTPDLRGRFPLGYGSGRGLTQRIIGEMGGEESHALIASEIPAHKHEFGGQARGSDEGTENLTATIFDIYYGYYDGRNLNGVTTSELEANNIYTVNEGKGEPHDNMPPFYVLNYIMKL